MISKIYNGATVLLSDVAMQVFCLVAMIWAVAVGDYMFGLMCAILCKLYNLSASFKDEK